jgi:hypothetical protein
VDQALPVAKLFNTVPALSLLRIRDIFFIPDPSFFIPEHAS